MISMVLELNLNKAVILKKENPKKVKNKQTKKPTRTKRKEVETIADKIYQQNFGEWREKG